MTASEELLVALVDDLEVAIYNAYPGLDFGPAEPRDVLATLVEALGLELVGWWGQAGDGYPPRFDRTIDAFAGLPEPLPVFAAHALAAKPQEAKS